MLEQIPGPPGYPIVGNFFDVRNEVPINGVCELAEKYGPIFKITTFGSEMVVVSSAKLLEELCDEKRFHKVIGAGLDRLNGDGPQGLFRSRSEADPDWGQAHRVLTPAFGPLSIQDMFDEMHDIATQLILKWARKGPEYRIPVTEDFTRLTLDTIALCAMDYRFNSFYQDELHPFVKAMNNTLGAASNTPSLLTMMWNVSTGRKQKSLMEDRNFMKETGNRIVKYLREHPIEKKDLLNAMINGKDPKTGESMRDELITANMVNFLVAGHETTSGLLSFTFARLLKSPEAYRNAQAEVDNVIGQGQMKVEHLKQLPYLNAVLREALRLQPTAPAFTRSLRPDNDEVCPSLGGYAINHQSKILALLPQCHRDPEVYGEDADEFKPERMLEENFKKLPKAAWKPFGTGVRACIGRPFAWQEALLVLALILQSFDVKLDDPGYELRVKQTLTIKPKDLYMRASPRKGMDATALQRVMMADLGKTSVNNEATQEPTPRNSQDLKELLVLYGSNSGTCQTLAQRLAVDAERYGYRGEIMDMDSGIDTIQQRSLAIIITASYEGEPPDNAAHFVHWLTSQSPHLGSLEYSVFGCGHSDWASTFQKIPTTVDTKLQEAGAKRIVDRGLADAARGDIFSDFDAWADSHLWPALKKNQGPSLDSDSGPRGLSVEMYQDDRAKVLRQDVKEGKVEVVRVLTAEGVPEKRHLDVLLPSGMVYQPGDYLAVLPLNPEVSVQRVMERYGIPWDSTMVIKSSSVPTTLPRDTPISVKALLEGYVELGQPATKKDLRRLEELATDEQTKTKLNILANADFETSILQKRTSILDFLSDHKSLDLPFNELLSMLPPMRTRYYSISSSPLHSPTHCTITYSVVNSPSSSHQGRFLGVASTYLRSLVPSDTIRMAVKPASKSFRLPLQMESTPIIMFCAGTGLAPFRGFIQHRAEIIQAGHKKLAPAILFVGSRSSTQDRLYAEEMDAWSAMGAVDIRHAFSRESDHPLAKGCKRVQDRYWLERKDVRDLWASGAKVFVCGGTEMAKSLGEIARRVVREVLREQGVKEEEVEGQVKMWMEKWRGERFVTDVFA